jgi:hypothetical protein
MDPTTKKSGIIMQSPVPYIRKNGSSPCKVLIRTSRSNHDILAFRSAARLTSVD